jgi:hypothetical protein
LASGLMQSEGKIPGLRLEEGAAAFCNKGCTIRWRSNSSFSFCKIQMQQGMKTPLESVSERYRRAAAVVVPVSCRAVPWEQAQLIRKRGRFGRMSGRSTGTSNKNSFITTKLRGDTCRVDFASGA